MRTAAFFRMNDANNETSNGSAPKKEGSIAHFTAVVSFFKLSYFIIAFAVKAVFARVAPKAITDAYFWAWENFNIVFTVGEDLLGSSYLPVFVHAKVKKGEERAWRYSSTVLTLQALAALAVAGGGIALAGAWAGTFGGNLAEEKLARDLLVVFLVGLTFLTVASTLTQNLNAYKKFTLAAFSEFANKIMVLLFLLLAVAFAPKLAALAGAGKGAQATARLAMYAAAGGFLAGVLAKFLLNVFGLRRQLRQWFRPSLNLRTEEMKALGLMIAALLIGSVGGKLRDMLEILFKQSITGVLSYVSYAKSLKEIPVIIFPFALGVVLFPYLSEAVARDDRRRLTELTMNSMRMMFLLFIPIVITYLFFGTDVVGLLFYNERNFGLADTANTGTILGIYALGFFAYIAEIIVLQTFFSYKDAVTPTIIALLCAVLHIAVLWGTFDRLTYAAIPLAYLVARTVKAGALFVLLLPRLKGGLEGELGRWGVFALKAGTAAAAGAAAAWGVSALLPAAGGGDGLRLLFLERAGAGGAAAVAGTALTAWLLRMEELAAARRVLGRAAGKVASLVRRGKER